MVAVTGKFAVGVNGRCDFELKPLTVGGAMDALEEAVIDYGDGVSQMRLRPYELARMMTLDGERVSTKDIMGLIVEDYEKLTEAGEELAKKLAGLTSSAADSEG